MSTSRCCSRKRSIRRWSRPICAVSRSGRQPAATIDRIASVASFFVSRIDTAADKLIAEKIARSRRSRRSAALRRSTARSPSPTPRLAYQLWQTLLFRTRAGKGSPAPAPRRSGSCGPRPAPKIKPIATSLCRGADRPRHRQHHADARRWTRSATTARLRDTLTEDAAEAPSDLLGELARAGISLDAITDELVDDGVRAVRRCRRQA